MTMKKKKVSKLEKEPRIDKINLNDSDDSSAVENLENEEGPHDLLNKMSANRQAASFNNQTNQV